MQSTTKRPVFLTVLCVLAFIGTPFAIAAPLFLIVRGNTILPMTYLYGNLIIQIAQVIGVIGVWKMKQWGVTWSIAFMAAEQVVNARFGLWHPLSLVEPTLVSIVLLLYIRKMD